MVNRWRRVVADSSEPGGLWDLPRLVRFIPDLTVHGVFFSKYFGVCDSFVRFAENDGADPTPRCMFFYADRESIVLVPAQQRQSCDDATRHPPPFTLTTPFPLTLAKTSTLTHAHTHTYTHTHAHNAVDVDVNAGTDVDVNVDRSGKSS